MHSGRASIMHTHTLWPRAPARAVGGSPLVPAAHLRDRSPPPPLRAVVANNRGLRRRRDLVRFVILGTTRSVKAGNYSAVSSAALGSW